MKALLSKAVGGPETLVLEDVASPEAKPGQAVVSVKAIGVNFPDVLIIEDKYQFKPERPFSPGGEISGVVKSVGEGVTHVKPGDRVLGNTGWGGMAEELALDASRLVKIPDSMPFDDAAAFIMTYGTSWHALKDRANLQAGQSMLVLGAAGGVGLAAVELGKAMGANVIAAASSQEKVDLCLSRGATSGVVYPKGPFDKEGQKALGALFKDATGPNGADVIYDGIGDAYAEPALRSIAWEGKYLVVGFAAGEIPKIPLNLALLKGCEIVGVFWGAWVAKNPKRHQESVAELMQMYADGKIKPHVSETFALADAAKAIAHLASRKAMGKVVVTV
ncbi:MAG: NADPH:quinone oxidoreductase family protein [Alphaproteobacteria bacterium]|nr:NADPH:quinone oxidoreductase family protein [Alphaproteobacteria bacterium]MBU1516320.1 NADPH:quinone oxidoreductase family protein [Alphaproteobacteria bacterium]MBU2093160.1 NADPH:quinone oxidoreductase family protein [Alphaproteobacteria bacterium]MBU2150420.1 NADPH:quinone oxidoreductase family protein [Alphaproteobacteria bacterium]MBU2308796.1 NADPH:quinone oxidoreductase family protein [Alphaproteobacteria bacterium]